MLIREAYLNHRFILPVCCITIICLVAGGIPVGAESGPLEITVQDAILMALENNNAFKIDVLKPEIQASQVEQEHSVFDVRMSNSLTTSSSGGISDPESRRTNLDIEFSKGLTTGGDISLGLGADRDGGGVDDNQYASHIDLSLSHPLFRGAGSDVTLARLHQSELSAQSSLYELRGFAESLVSQVEGAYWDYALAEKQLEIYEESLSLAEDQLYESEVMVKVGKIAEIELVASQAEVASRKEGLINARSNLATIRLRFLRLINPPGIDFWDQEIVIKDQPAFMEFDLGEIGALIETALQMRPDLNQAELLLERNELDVLTTRNGLLPNLEFFITLGMSGYSDSFGDSFSNISGGNGDLFMGLNYTLTFGERDLHARHRQSIISREQAEEALNNMVQLAKEDVGVAWIEVNRTIEQIAATSASRVLQEEKLRAETEKYRVGKSTSLLVAQAQRDLLAAQIAEIQAVVNYQKSLVDLFRQEGTLLQRYGISFADGYTE